MSSLPRSDGRGRGWEREASVWRDATQLATSTPHALPPSWPSSFPTLSLSVRRCSQTMCIAFHKGHWQPMSACLRPCLLPVAVPPSGTYPALHSYWFAQLTGPATTCLWPLAPTYLWRARMMANGTRPTHATTMSAPCTLTSLMLLDMTSREGKYSSVASETRAAVAPKRNGRHLLRNG